MPAAVYPVLESAVLLCIDDNEDLLECERSFLESFGYSVLTAESGGKGLASLQALGGRCNPGLLHARNERTRGRH